VVAYLERLFFEEEDAWGVNLFFNRHRNQGYIRLKPHPF